MSKVQVAVFGVSLDGFAADASGPRAPVAVMTRDFP